ncbi:MAG: amidohydrolase family protein [Neomegalonema sp.]|nr:amidohydrolase family protein [Neomegalonema sp.]
MHNARLIDPEALSETPGGVLIEEGRILDVGPHLLDPDTVAEAWRIDCTGHAVAPGVIDLRVHAGEPGERHNESFGTVGEAAVAGGVTTIVTRPDTNPAVDDPALLDFIAKRIGEEQQQHAMPRVYSMAALTKGVAGELMAEFAFLTQHASCVGLSNGQRSVANAQVLRRCLAYAADLGALVSHHSQDPTLTGTGCATSGAFATRMGLPGPGPLAESMALERDLALALAAGVEYHAEQISVAASLEVLRRARERSGRISAAVSLPHLLFDEADIQDYRTFYKMFPPLRAGADRAAMVEALRGGLIDCITSSHRARNEESKRQPYEAAATGAVGVETLLSGAMELVAQGALSLPQLFEKLSLNPARRLSVMRPQIFSDLGRLSRGARADLIVFDDGLSWQLDRRWLRSKSKNSPFDKAMMRGLVRQTLVDGAVVHTAEPEPQGAP